VEFIEFNTDASVEHKTGEISVHQVSRSGRLGFLACVARLLPGRDMDTNAQDENHMASSRLQPDFGPVLMAQALIDRGANVSAGINGGEALLYQEAEGEYHIQRYNLGITERLTRAWRRPK